MLYELLNQDNAAEQVFHPSIQDSPIRKFHYDPPGEKYSRKVFVGGLPPDIDESKFICVVYIAWDTEILPRYQTAILLKKNILRLYFCLSQILNNI